MADDKKTVDYKAWKDKGYALLAFEYLNGNSDKKSLIFPAVQLLYKSMVKDPKDADMILAPLLEKASKGLETGNITSPELVEVISNFAGRYESIYNEMSVGDFVKTYELKDLPKNITSALKKYEKTQIGKLDKKNKEQVAVLQAIQVLKQREIHGNLGSKVLKLDTENNLNAIDSGLEALVKKAA